MSRKSTKSGTSLRSDAPTDVLDRESPAGFAPAGEMQPGQALLFQDMTIMAYRCDVACRFALVANPLRIAGEYRVQGLTNALAKQLIVTLESKYGRPVETSNDRQVYETARNRIIFAHDRSFLIHAKK